VVHRDLKPSNIMVDESGRVRVTDFGVAHLEDSAAQLTRTGMFLGTPEYASPEQASGGPLDRGVISTPWGGPIPHAVGQTAHNRRITAQGSGEDRHGAGNPHR